MRKLSDDEDTGAIGVLDQAENNNSVATAVIDSLSANAFWGVFCLWSSMYNTIALFATLFKSFGFGKLLVCPKQKASLLTV